MANRTFNGNSDRFMLDGKWYDGIFDGGGCNSCAFRGRPSCHDLPGCFDCHFVLSEDQGFPVSESVESKSEDELNAEILQWRELYRVAHNRAEINATESDKWFHLYIRANREVNILRSQLAKNGIEPIIPEQDSSVKEEK